MSDQVGQREVEREVEGRGEDGGVSSYLGLQALGRAGVGQRQQHVEVGGHGTCPHVERAAGRGRIGGVAGGREGLNIITDWEKEGRELALPRLAMHTTL